MTKYYRFEDVKMLESGKENCDVIDVTEDEDVAIPQPFDELVRPIQDELECTSDIMEYYRLAAVQFE